jgi:hypothetical protein
MTATLKRPSVFDLITEAADLVRAVGALDPDQDIEGQLAELLCGWLDDAEDKLGALRVVKLRLEAEAELLKTEAKRLQNRARTLSLAVGRVRSMGVELLQAHAEISGETKIKTSEYTAWLTTSERVEGPDAPAAWPGAFRREEIVIKVDKTAAKRALKSGKKISGLRLVPSTSITWR